MLYSDPLRENAKLANLVVKYFQACGVAEVKAVLFQENAPLFVKEETSGLAKCFKALDATQVDSWTEMDVAWLLEHHSAAPKDLLDALVRSTTKREETIIHAVRLDNESLSIFHVRGVCVDLNFARLDGNGVMPIGLATVGQLSNIQSMAKANMVVVDWNFVNKHGENALFYNIRVAEWRFLIEQARCSLSLVSKRGETPLHRLVFRRIELILGQSSNDMTLEHFRWVLEGRSPEELAVLWGGPRDLLLRIVNEHFPFCNQQDIISIVHFLMCWGYPFHPDNIAALLTFFVEMRIQQWVQKPLHIWPWPAANALPPLNVVPLKVSDVRFIKAVTAEPRVPPLGGNNYQSSMVKQMQLSCLFDFEGKDEAAVQAMMGGGGGGGDGLRTIIM